MQQEASSHRIEHRLTSLFPSVMLEDHAEDTGVVERNRTLQMPAQSGCLCSGLLPEKVGHWLISAAATTQLPTRHSI